MTKTALYIANDDFELEASGWVIHGRNIVIFMNKFSCVENVHLWCNRVREAGASFSKEINSTARHETTLARRQVLSIIR